MSYEETRAETTSAPFLERHVSLRLLGPVRGDYETTANAILVHYRCTVGSTKRLHDVPPAVDRFNPTGTERRPVRRVVPEVTPACAGSSDEISSCPITLRPYDRGRTDEFCSRPALNIWCESRER